MRGKERVEHTCEVVLRQEEKTEGRHSGVSTSRNLRFTPEKFNASLESGETWFIVSHRPNLTRESLTQQIRATLPETWERVEVVPSTPKIAALQAMRVWERPQGEVAQTVSGFFPWQVDRVDGSQWAVSTHLRQRKKTPATWTPKGRSQWVGDVSEAALRFGCRCPPRFPSSSIVSIPTCFGCSCFFDASGYHHVACPRTGILGVSQWRAPEGRICREAGGIEVSVSFGKDQGQVWASLPKEAGAANVEAEMGRHSGLPPKPVFLERLCWSSDTSDRSSVHCDETSCFPRKKKSLVISHAIASIQLFANVVDVTWTDVGIRENDNLWILVWTTSWTQRQRIVQHWYCDLTHSEWNDQQVDAPSTVFVQKNIQRKVGRITCSMVSSVTSEVLKWQRVAPRSAVHANVCIDGSPWKWTFSSFHENTQMFLGHLGQRHGALMCQHRACIIYQESSLISFFSVAHFLHHLSECQQHCRQKHVVNVMLFRSTTVQGTWRSCGMEIVVMELGKHPPRISLGRPKCQGYGDQICRQPSRASLCWAHLMAGRISFTHSWTRSWEIMQFCGWLMSNLGSLVALHKGTDQLHVACGQTQIGPPQCRGWRLGSDGRDFRERTTFAKN